MSTEPAGNRGLPPHRIGTVVVLAASAGGLDAVSTVLRALPADFPAPVLVVQHLEPERSSPLAGILAMRTALTVRQAAEGDRLQPGLVLVAPPDHHLLIDAEGEVSLSLGHKEHFSRPSADVTLRSVAAAAGTGAIAVILSGMGSDGALGALAIKRAGGTVIAQNEATAAFFGMPGAAIASGGVDRVLPLDAIAAELIGLIAREGADERSG